MALGKSEFSKQCNATGYVSGNRTFPVRNEKEFISMSALEMVVRVIKSDMTEQGLVLETGP